MKRKEKERKEGKEKKRIEKKRKEKKRKKRFEGNSNQRKEKRKNIEREILCLWRESDEDDDSHFPFRAANLFHRKKSQLI